MTREDGRSAKEAYSATADKKPAALVNRRRVSRHEAVACGDPGSGAEIEAGAGGWDDLGGSPEEPATAEGGPETKGAVPNAEP